jgi:hypothetical protein
MSDLALDTFGEVDFSQKGPYFIHGADAVAQHLRIRLRFYLGEWFLDTRVGIPFYTQIFVKNPNLAAINTVFRRAIVSTPGVEILERLDLALDSATRQLTLEFTAKLDGEDVARNFTEVFIL